MTKPKEGAPYHNRNAAKTAKGWQDKISLKAEESKEFEAAYMLLENKTPSANPMAFRRWVLNYCKTVGLAAIRQELKKSEHYHDLAEWLDKKKEETKRTRSSIVNEALEDFKEKEEKKEGAK